ncbi:MAG: amidohydrolase family protein [Deltaproteobacteria bacterium]|nr:amidohydrolase family protein [Deltaproteobacteria bacterium]
MGTATSTWIAPWVVIPGKPPLRDGALVLDAGGLVRAVPASEVESAQAEVLKGIVMPALVNAHTHLELSHMSVPGGDGLVPWVTRLVAQRTPPLPSAIESAVRFLEKRGTGFVVDIANSRATFDLLSASRLAFRIFLERVAPRPEAEPTLPHVEDARVRMTSHSTYATHERALRETGAASIHVEEDPAEGEWLTRGKGPLATLLPERIPPGKRPIPYLDSLGLLGPGALLVHATCADDDSLRLAAERDAVIVLCPRSNHHIGGKLPRWQAVRAAGVRVALGTDSLASCPSLDVLGDVATLARDGADPAWLLHVATISGRAAVGFHEPHPFIEVGDNARTIRDPLAFVAHEGVNSPIRRLA